jgi:hypothetical protein
MMFETSRGFIMKYPIIFILLTAVMALAVNGCSVIGLGIGAVSDSRKPDSLMIPCCQITTIKPGSEMNVILVEGEPVRGALVSLDSVTAESYAQRYSRYKEDNRADLPLPSLGESVEITLKSGVRGERELVGFDYKYTTKRPKGKITPVATSYNSAMVVRQESDTTLGKVLLSQLNQVTDADGNVIQGETLESMAKSGQLPFLSSLALVDSAGYKHIPMDKVKRVELKNKKHDKWKALVAGAVFDSFLIILFIASLENLGGLGTD